MQNQTQDFAQRFLIEFTKQLIINSTPKKAIELKPKEKIPVPAEVQHLANIDTHPKKKLIKKTPSQIPVPSQPVQNIPLQPTQSMPPQQGIPTPRQQIEKPRLTMPKPFLPPRFQTIRPTATKREIDLGKLNPILEDPAVNSLECDGPDIPIRIVTGRGMKKNTEIVLTKEEINKIIETFSTLTKIPALEGVYKVAAGNLILLSVISEIMGTKFIIKKIPQNQPPAQPQMRGRMQVPSKRVLMPPK